jgi:hypothetical protein
MLHCQPLIADRARRFLRVDSPLNACLNASSALAQYNMCVLASDNQPNANVHACIIAVPIIPPVNNQNRNLKRFASNF